MRKIVAVGALLSFASLGAIGGETVPDIVGAWQTTAPLKQGHAVEVFLADGTYCSLSSTSSTRPFSTGTWEATGFGVAVGISGSDNAKEITQSPIREIRVVRAAAGGILMGYPCDHCEDGIAGTLYERSKMTSTCRSMGPNNSFKPKPLRGSA
jgi:hypothetical protein